MQPLDPLSLPLQGRRLIEAGAGTGKTFTIALLYLRLLLEHGLEVPEILVVTFTNSATEELRGRIRSRLRQALNLLSEGRPSEDDPLLAGLLGRVTDHKEGEAILVDALARMDEAAIFTIHGFCRRMLQDNAFETGGPFEREFLENETPLRREIIEDFWRRSLYGAGRREADWAISQWSDPQGLAEDLRGPLSQPDIRCIPRVEEAEIRELAETAENFFQEVCRQWRVHGDDVTALLRHDSCLSRNKKNGYSEERVDLALEAMEQLTAAATFPWLPAAEIELFSAAVMQSRLKKKCSVDHPFFHCFEQFYSTLHRFLSLRRIWFLQQARQFLLRELFRRKNRLGVLCFDDLLSGLEDALRAAGGAALAAAIRRRFPVALVDEFQDTDPRQYAIFDLIYGGEDSALLMIGDAKQAIYSFRGADIFTYIRARRETPQRYTLDTNYRSSRRMVDAVNALFSRRDSFVFSDDIRHEPLKSASRADETPFLIDGHGVSPLAVWLLPGEIGKGKRISKDRAGEEAAGLCAGEIVRLLRRGREGRARIGERPLAAGDLTILVRSRREADRMQRALANLGVTCVYYSRDSVFAGRECRQMERLLSAVLNPADEGGIRSALTTDFFGFDASMLHELTVDESQWEEILSEFQEYHLTWRSFGVAVMLQRLLAKRRTVHRLSAAVDGERRLTNMLHLAELLQEQSRHCDGMEGLLNRLRLLSGDPGEAMEGEQLRLESDENLVRIVTIHRSKGLEYEIVFLPFIWDCRKVAADRPFPFHDPHSLELMLNMDIHSPPASHYRRAELERLAEDLRLFYVAVTRARYRCYFCWGPISKAENSALAYLLHPAGKERISRLAELDEEGIRKDIDRLNSHGLLVEFLPRQRHDETDERLDPLQPSQEKSLYARQPGAGIETRWRISSYSQLAGRRLQAEHIPRAASRESAASAERDAFSFPRGSRAGSFLHALLEEVDFSTTGKEEEVRNLVRMHLDRAGIAANWLDPVCAWLPTILGTPLTVSGPRLRDLKPEERVTEMGFYFTLAPAPIAGLNRLLSDHGFSRVDEGEDGWLQGLMKGFIDLVFFYRGRYWLADYKSNHLGHDYADYEREALARAVREHRYDLQYLIYTVALHRHLRLRLPDYDYERHFGGAYYLFLRGMHPRQRTGIFFSRPEKELIRRLDQLWGGGRQRLPEKGE